MLLDGVADKHAHFKRRSYGRATTNKSVDFEQAIVRLQRFHEIALKFSNQKAIINFLLDGYEKV